MPTAVETPQDLFAFKLGATLKMENTVLEMLGELEEKAQSEDLKEKFSHHADETREQIRNLKTFQLDHRIERPVSLSTRTGSVAMSAS